MEQTLNDDELDELFYDLLINNEGAKLQILFKEGLASEFIPPKVLRQAVANDATQSLSVLISSIESKQIVKLYDKDWLESHEHDITEILLEALKQNKPKILHIVENAPHDIGRHANWFTFNANLIEYFKKGGKFKDIKFIWNKYKEIVPPTHGWYDDSLYKYLINTQDFEAVVDSWNDHKGALFALLDFTEEDIEYVGEKNYLRAIDYLMGWIDRQDMVQVIEALNRTQNYTAMDHIDRYYLHH